MIQIALFNHGTVPPRHEYRSSLGRCRVCQGSYMLRSGEKPSDDGICRTHAGDSPVKPLPGAKERRDAWPC